MVKLLRIVGDVTKSNTQVNADFKAPVKIEPNSRIALHSIKLELADSEVNESFVITAANNNFTVRGLALDYQVIIPNGTYTGPDFLAQLLLQLTYQGASGANDYYSVQLVNDKLEIIKSNQRYKQQDLLNEWSIVDGSPILTATGGFNANASPTSIIVQSPELIANASFKIAGSVTTVDDVEIIAGETGVKLAINSGVWEYGLSGTAIVAASPGDTFAITKKNGSLVYTINGIDTVATWTVNDQDLLNKDDTRYWSITAPAGSTAVLAGITAATDDDLDDAYIGISIGSEKLARYLGFKHSNVIYQAIGEPARLISTETPRGESLADILVCVDPFILDSYSADARASNLANNNIVYALQKTDIGTVIAEEITNLIPLGLKNANVININTMNVTFRSRANGNLLKFADNPSLVFLVYGPNE